MFSRWSKAGLTLVLLVSLTATHLAFGQKPAAAAPGIQSFSAELLEGTADTVRLSWATTGATKLYILGLDDRNRPIHIDAPSGEKDVHVGWGVRSYTLAVKDSAGAWRYRTIDTAAVEGEGRTDGITPPPPVDVTSVEPKVINYFRSPAIDSELPDHTITWTKATTVDFVRVRHCVGNTCSAFSNITGTSLAVDGNALASVNDDGTFGGLLAPSGQGEVAYELTACETRPDSTAFCGEPVKTYVQVLPAQTTAPFREYRNHPVWLGHTVSWSANGGDLFFVNAPTLGVESHATRSGSYTFTAAQLNNAGPGLHPIRIKSCRDYGNLVLDCATIHPVKANASGTVSGLMKQGTVWPGATIAKVNGVDLPALTRGGKVAWHCDCAGQNVAAGTLLARVETYDYSLTELQLGGGQSSTTTPWTTDFDEAEVIQANVRRELRPGNKFTANGTSILPNGDIYALGEFTTSAAVVVGDAAGTRPLPLRHEENEENEAGASLDPVRPYGNALTQTATSNSQDSFKDSTGKVWSSHGWAGGGAETQKVTVDATSGNWTLTFGGQTTANIASEATEETVLARLVALSNIDTGEVAVAGEPGGPYTVQFLLDLAANVPQMTARNVSLRGNGASVSVATERDGRHNHSRILRYDPAATDSASTLQDDRFCAYNVPGNQNDVMGVTNGGGKTWFIESYWSDSRPARLTWFNPGDSAFGNCAAQNTFNYGSSGSPVVYPPGPTFSPGYCAGPATTNCFSSVEAPASLGAPSHLAYDAADNAIWTSSYMFGAPSSLGRYDLASGQWSVYPLPAPVTFLPPWVPHTWGGSSTWEISVSGNHVYINDHTDGDIIRFDKTYGPKADCAALRSETQQVSVDATSGNFTLTFMGGKPTAAIGSEAPAATVASRLETLENVGPGGVSVTGSAGGPYTINFQGQHAAKDVGQLLATNVSLVGGGAKASVTTTQAGGTNACMSEVHLPSFWTWQSIARGSKLYWTATGPSGGAYTGGISKEPYVNDESKFGYIDLDRWGAITTYTGLEAQVAPERAAVGRPTYSWFDVDQGSGRIAIGQPSRGQFLRLTP